MLRLLTLKLFTNSQTIIVISSTKKENNKEGNTK
jgi:hypothetical protein